MSFILQHEEKIHWEALCSNPNCPIDLIKKQFGGGRYPRGCNRKECWKRITGNEGFWKRLIERDLIEALMEFSW